MKYYTILGRLPEEENELWQGWAESRAWAVRKMERMLLTNHGITKKELREQGLEHMFVEACVVSDNKLKVSQNEDGGWDIEAKG